MENIILTIISVIGTLVGTVLGVVLTHYYDKHSKKVRMCFSLQPSTENDEISSKFKTKTSPSGYLIKVYNIGQTPFILKQISLRYKQRTIVDCMIPCGHSMMPFDSYEYQIDYQEYEDILFYCKKSGLKKCYVVAYDVGGKCVKDELDLILPYMQSRIINE